VRTAIEMELERGGQTYFVHKPRGTIYDLAAKSRTGPQRGSSSPWQLPSGDSVAAVRRPRPGSCKLAEASVARLYDGRQRFEAFDMLVRPHSYSWFMNRASPPRSPPREAAHGRMTISPADQFAISRAVVDVSTRCGRSICLRARAPSRSPAHQLLVELGTIGLDRMRSFGGVSITTYLSAR